MEALLTAIVSWLAINYGLPVSEELPGVRFEPPMEIVFLFRGAVTPEEQREIIAEYAAHPVINRREAIAVYDRPHSAIVLPLGWTARSPHDVSELVHEMVHHLQTKAGLRYLCAEEREAPAYAAQEQWLGQFGTTLEREFAIDAMTLFVSTHCPILE